MRHDDHFIKEKNVIRLKNEIDRIRSIRYKECWIPYEKPVWDGYYLSYGLREDIANRVNSHVYQEALNQVNIRVWGYSKYVLKQRYNWYLKHKQSKYNDNRFVLKSIYLKQYKELAPDVQKLFYEDITWNRISWGLNNKKYLVSFRPYELVPKFSKAYFTHYKEVNSTLLRWEYELNQELYNINNNPWGSYSWRDDFRERKEKHRIRKEIKEEQFHYFNSKIELDDSEKFHAYEEYVTEIN